MRQTAHQRVLSAQCRHWHRGAYADERRSRDGARDRAAGRRQAGGCVGLKGKAEIVTELIENEGGGVAMVRISPLIGRSEAPRHQRPVRACRSNHINIASRFPLELPAFRAIKAADTVS